MRRKLYSACIILLPLCFSAQTYQWQWGKQAGGYDGSANSGFTYSQDESIRDIAVDSNNNVYYLATSWPGDQNIDNTPIVNYGLQDLILYSTDCNGNLRWATTIGGGGFLEYAWNIELDNNGGLYMMATLHSQTSNGGPNSVPTHLDPTHTLPRYAYYYDVNIIDPGRNSSFLLKYNTSDGNLAWNRALQGGVSMNTCLTDTKMMYMDSQKNLHAIIGFSAGTHLNGAVTVPSSLTMGLQYYLVKFNYDNGNMTQSTPVLLPVVGQIGETIYSDNVNFVYDENLHRYYIAGYRAGRGFLYNFSFNGTAITKKAFLLAFDVNGSTVTEAWRKEIDNMSTVGMDDEIHSIIKDANTSDIYISGRYSSDLTTPATFGSYNFPLVPYITQRPFVMKLSSDGTVLWTKLQDTSTNDTNAGYRFMRGTIVQNGNEIGFAHATWGATWGSYTMTRASGERADPILVRLNKDNGSVIGGADILSNAGKQDEFTSIAVDNDGNYLLGGFFHGQLFLDANDNVPTMDMNVSTGKSQNFYTKYAMSACETMSVEETAAEVGMQIYPNPVHDYIYIKSKKALVSYEVYNAVGQLVNQGSLHSNTEQINLSALSTGVYYLKLRTQNNTVTEKIIKQ